MRVWVIGRAVPAKHNNMNGSFEYEQAQMLAARGLEVYYPAVDLRSVRRWRKFGVVHTQSQNMHTIMLNIPIGKLFPGRLRNWVGKWCKQWLYGYMVKKFGLPDVIHIHYPALWAYDPFEALQKQGVKIVATEHWSQVQNGTLPEKNKNFLKEYTKKCDALMCVGQHLREAIVKLTGTDREIIVAPNVVPDIFCYAERKKPEESPFRFVAAGRLIASKRFDLLIEAFASVFEASDGVVLDIIGGGEERKALEEIIEEQGCADRVHLLGVMERAQIARYYQNCDALVLSSNLETFGVPVIEAMACGMPVVTTDAIGFLEHMSSENSIVVEADNKDQLATAMRYMYEHYEQYERKTIAKAAVDCFGENAVYSRISSIYNEISSI